MGVPPWPRRSRIARALFLDGKSPGDKKEPSELRVPDVPMTVQVEAKPLPELRQPPHRVKRATCGGCGEPLPNGDQVLCLNPNCRTHVPC